VYGNINGVFSKASTGKSLLILNFESVLTSLVYHNVVAYGAWYWVQNLTLVVSYSRPLDACLGKDFGLRSLPSSDTGATNVKAKDPSGNWVVL
jgi:hypothetical protein